VGQFEIASQFAVLAQDPISRRSAPEPVQSGRFDFAVRDRKDYIRMLEGFRNTGGVLSGEQIVLQMRDSFAQPLSTLARWIVRRDVLSFEWQSHILVPLFQFELEPFLPRPGVRTVVEELSDAFDEWEMAAWFSSPNTWLDGASPAEEFGHDEAAVFHAARADRFIALV
jgi:hypothetical protein